MYADLLIGERVRQSSRGKKSLYEEVESDRARVLYSASFRRLQRKTQVFPLEDNAAVRTRLTHSLEVAHVGRFLASKIIEKANAAGYVDTWGLRGEVAHAFQIVTEVACLLHDIGNPPFGHFGEVAIGDWCGRQDALQGSDLIGFDGNPQGFRIVSTLAGLDAAGMNLTLSQLAAILKYPATHSEQVALGSKRRYKKFGVFATEAERLEQIRSKLGLGIEQRFCIAYVMEAADDISYCLSDIEDGVEKGLIAPEAFFREIEKGLSGGARNVYEIGRENSKGAAGTVDEVVAFRAAIITRLVEVAAECYVTQHAQVMSGEMHELVGENTQEGEFLKQLKAVVSKTLYSSNQIVKLELAGRKVVGGILEEFSPLLSVDEKDFRRLLDGERVKGLDVQRRLAALLAKSHRVAYAAYPTGDDVGNEPLRRAHLLVDFVSGMTDPFAVDTFQRLTGSARL